MIGALSLYAIGFLGRRQMFGLLDPLSALVITLLEISKVAASLSLLGCTRTSFTET